MELKLTYDNNAFIVNDDGDSFAVESPLNLVNTSDVDDYDMFIMKSMRRDAAENSIYSVYFGNRRVGWIFPIQALVSTEHDYAENDNFCEYAYVAYHKLIQEYASQFLKNYDESFGNICSLEEVVEPLDMDKHILLICTDNLDESDKIGCIDKYRFGMYVNGYIIDDGSNFTKIDDYEPLKKRLTIHKLTDDICQMGPMLNIVNDIVPAAIGPYSSFMMMYQIIEVSIGKIFDVGFQRLLDNYNEGDDLYRLKENISNISNEKYRVRELFNGNFVKITSQHRSNLIKACENILGCNYKNDMAELLYEVRCQMVHRFYNYSKDNTEPLLFLNKSFMNVLYDILTSFVLHDNKSGNGTA